MQHTDVLVVGGSAAGMMAALTARRYYPDKSVTVIRREERALVPCGIPYIFGTLGSPDKNLLPDAALSRAGVDLVIDSVLSIDREAGAVLTASSGTIQYSRLILAAGSSPALPPVKGIHLPGVFVIKKDAAYLTELQRALDAAQHLVIVGGGFIGVEFADECRKGRSLDVTIVEVLPHCLATAVDEGCSLQVEETLQARGVKVITNDSVDAVEGYEQVEQVRLASGELLPADVVIFAVGVRPNTELACQAGLKVDHAAGIWVDDFMRTSDPRIFAVGDCAAKNSFFGHVPSKAYLASVATHEARVAGANLYGLRRSRSPVVGVFSTVVGDLAVGAAGLTEKAAMDLGLNPVVGEVEAVDRHPGGMPGARPLHLRLVFARDTGVIVGGQVWGGASVGELVNVIGLAIQHKMRADELETMQIGTHPALTSSPIAYALTGAAQSVAVELQKR